MTEVIALKKKLHGEKKSSLFRVELVMFEGSLKPGKSVRQYEIKWGSFKVARQ